MNEVTIFWFRRDLRLEDNRGLYRAQLETWPVQPVFIFDTGILDKLTNRRQARVEFIHAQLLRLQDELRQRGASMDVRTGDPVEVWAVLCREYVVRAVWANRDYEPYARARDRAVHDLLQGKGIPFRTRKDHTLFERDEILKKDGRPYLVYTPYSRVWRQRLSGEDLAPCPSATQSNWVQTGSKPVPAPSQLGFEPAGIAFPPRTPDEGIIRNYHKTRDFPALQGTTRLGAHLRFGTVSIRALAAMAAANFDKERSYIRRWVPEYGTPDYPPPMVDHKAARERALAAYRRAQSGNPG